MSMVMALTTDHPVPPHQLNADVPPALNNLILRLLAQNVADRPASAQAVVDALLAIERDGPASAAWTITLPTEPPLSPPTGRTATLRRPQASPPSPASISRRWLALVGLLLLVLGPLGYYFGGQIIRIVTNQGELVIVVDDPAVEVK